jgi:hypothetical protein
VLLFDADPPPEHAATTATRTARFRDRERLTTRDAMRAAYTARAAGDRHVDAVIIWIHR